MLTRLKNNFYDLSKIVLRFPITIVLLVAWAIRNGVKIFSDKYYVFDEYAYAFLIGASLYIVLQILYERFFNDKKIIRYVFMVISIVSTIIYYIIINYNGVTDRFIIKTFVILFIFFIAFLWIPTVNSKVTFNETFSVAFRSFFTVALFVGLLNVGILLILETINFLIIEIDDSIHRHILNIIFVLYAPIHFLGFIPLYKEEKDKKLSKFLESLISYIFVPISGIFTVILLLYVLLNIGGDFWKDNLLEPMLVAYSISVVLIYLLASRVDNTFSNFYRKFIPKILIPIVLFQTISSVLKIGEKGITHGRYYVIMFGIFAIVAGIIFSIVSHEKNGIIAPILIALSIISILPPIDAFTISRANQINRLEKVLVKNDMISGDTLYPKADISEDDKEIIRNSIQYLNTMEYTKSIEWLKGYSASENFESSFGFEEYVYGGMEKQYKEYFRDETGSLEITGYDFIMKAYISSQSNGYIIGNLQSEGKDYILLYDEGEEAIILVDDRDSKELIRVDIDDIFARLDNIENDSGQLSNHEAELSVENEKVILTIITRRAYIDILEHNRFKEAEMYILIGFKE